MFDKPFYKLDEVAKLLETETKNVLYLLDSIICTPLDDAEDIPEDEKIYLYAMINDDEIERNKMNRTMFKYKGLYQIANRYDIEDVISAYEREQTTVSIMLLNDCEFAENNDGTIKIIEKKGNKCDVSVDCFYVDNETFHKIKALKAKHDGKPTLEELQAENEALKKQLDALSNSTTKGKQQQRELILSGWIAGKGLDTAKRMKQSDIHEELKRVHGLFQIAESTFKDFWQAQKLIKLDTGKR